MIFAAPWVLLALAILPVLWWLLRVTPPSPRIQAFPAIRLLAGLRAREETAARTPWWLLALRLLAAALINVGLAGPVLDAATGLPGTGPMLLVIDNGCGPPRPTGTPASPPRKPRSTAPSAPARKAALLTTAGPPRTRRRRSPPVLPVSELRPRVAALHPEPWPSDRAAATAALRGASGTVVYIADGLASPGDAAFSAALAAAGPVTEITPPSPPRPACCCRPVRRPASSSPAPPCCRSRPRSTSPCWRKAATAAPSPAPTAHVPAGESEAEMPVTLPPELRNKLTRLVLEGPASAGSVLLLDEGFRRRPVGLISADSGAETPLTGELFYLERALAPFTELRHGDLHTLLQRDISRDRARRPAGRAGRAGRIAGLGAAWRQC